MKLANSHILEATERMLFLQTCGGSGRKETNKKNYVDVELVVVVCLSPAHSPCFFSSSKSVYAFCMLYAVVDRVPLRDWSVLPVEPVVGAPCGPIP